ncbi:arabinogalactan oligomer/maltooligosaccharide transport system substrate-binding protein [Saccharopolyspora lacisalsi]|uniref:Arabinogalactan oligomer/maltooligosaccharide transport system substrate-binding protein n=1 Tax=Halosaccharopolyspora lacisalsi TaxID=1000566 RepID=A0A839DZD0_9PSEU|nr:extracellular solute-binding protein [Halosaccharopolyspora lacisalsi]MBA8825596.1 arabinogalactan oligomer/maltooligosaccharide transport system substrate-binding protein [Halosaccharopolyspora lacisalsi]
MRPKNLARATAVVLTGALVLTACGSGGTEHPNAVVYWDTSGPAENPVFTELARDCARRGGYRVAVENVAYDQALNNFKTAAQGGNGPDVLRADVGWVAQLAQGGLIKDLSGTRLSRSTADFLDVPLRSTRHQGKSYGVPQVTDTLALFYNERELAEAGVDPPETWKELKSIAPKLGGDSALFINNDEYYALPFLYSTGGSLVDVESKTITVDSGAGVRGLGIAKRLLEAEAARTALDQPNSYTNMKAAFTSGEVTMMIDGPWVTPTLFESELFSGGENLGVAPIPGPPGVANSPVGGHDYVIRQGSDSGEDSVEFVECMSSPRAQAEIAAELGLLPTRESVYDDPSVSSNPVVSEFAPLLDDAHERAWIPQGNELLKPLQTAYADILAGKRSPREAADSLATRYEEVVVPEYSRN